jgi:hypothetical protein
MKRDFGKDLTTESTEGTEIHRVFFLSSVGQKVGVK